MSRWSSFALALSTVSLASACADHSSSGGAPEGASAEDIAALREELALAGVQPLSDAPVVSDELFALGQALFFDKILSGNEEISCATCHLPEFATGDGRTLPDGVHGIGFGPNRGDGELIPRNAPALFAVHLKSELFWDGQARDAGVDLALPPAVSVPPEMRTVFTPGLELLAAQAMLPPVSREEMRGMAGENPVSDLGDGYGSPGGTADVTLNVWIELNERLLDLPGYVSLLTAAYPGVAIRDFTFAHAGNAVAAFEARAFHRVDSPFERFVRGNDAALTRDEVRGALQFFSAGCADCHSGAILSDEDFHNTGMPQLGPGVDRSTITVPRGWDIGRENVTQRLRDRFEFSTPSLLNVALTGPWGHAGQFAELGDMVAHYSDPELSTQQYDIQSNVSDPELVTMLVSNSDAVLATIDTRIGALGDFDVDAIVAFLHALTADDADLSDVVPASVPSGLPVF